MAATLLLFPHQLFPIFHISNSNGTKWDRIVLVEEPLFFKDSERIESFSTVKLIFTRATMSAYLQEILECISDVKVERIEYKEIVLKGLEECLFERKIRECSYFDPVDRLLSQRIAKWKQVGTHVMETPNFIATRAMLEEYKSTVKGDPFFQTSFYRYMRIKLNVLMNKDGSFKGGKLTFDSDNRERMPPAIKPPKACIDHTTEELKHIKEAEEYVRLVFDREDDYELLFPITRAQATIFWKKFLEERFDSFGPYQDAIRKNTTNPVMFHSGVSMLINCGVLDPRECLEDLIAVKNVRLNSIEGFVRQLIGWREFIRFVYLEKGEEMRGSNLLSAEKTLDDRFYKGKTGIQPLDDAILCAFRYGYLHHILRLMVVSNFMTVAGVSPHQVYKWMMEFSLDSYDWVMVPNVYGMATFASPLMSTKPYISSSAYVLRMSDYPKGEWTHIWDALYYDFLERNKGVLTIGKLSARMGLMYSNWNKKDALEKKRLLGIAAKFLKTLTKLP